MIILDKYLLELFNKGLTKESVLSVFVKMFEVVNSIHPIGIIPS